MWITLQATRFVRSFYVRVILRPYLSVQMNVFEWEKKHNTNALRHRLWLWYYKNWNKFLWVSWKHIWMFCNTKNSFLFPKSIRAEKFGILEIYLIFFHIFFSVVVWNWHNFWKNPIFRLNHIIRGIIVWPHVIPHKDEKKRIFNTLPVITITTFKFAVY